MTRRRAHLLSVAVLLGAVLAVVLAIVLGELQQHTARRPLPGPDVTPLPLSPAEPLPEGAVRVLAAGDIGRCGSRAAAATGALIDAVPDATVVALGDIAYERGSDSDFRDCYDPFWGHARDRTIPVAGNHEYGTPRAAGYFRYFGAAAGTPDAPWRALELGTWRLYALDTECGKARTCGNGSAQLAWLREDLVKHPTPCTVAIFHHPRFSSGRHGPDLGVDALWRLLAGAGVDIVLAGHDHHYERLAPADADGRSAEGGTRSWVVGTGGAQLYPAGAPLPITEAVWDRAHGVLELVLRADGYDWAFRAAIGEPFEDVGSGSC